MRLIDYFQGEKRHAIDLLLAIYELSVRNPDRAASWKDIKEWFRENKLRISTRSYWRRRDEMEDLGLIRKIPIGNRQYGVKITDKGRGVASIVREFIKKIEGFS